MLSYTLNPSQTVKNYGFEIIGSTFDPIFTKAFLQSKPHVSIIGTSCFIDYSDCYNTSDRISLIKLFKNTPAGTTFNFSEADYFDEEQNIIKSVDGIFSLNSLTGNNKLIIGNIISGFTYENNYKFYNKNNFTTVPQYASKYTGATSANYIINNLNNGQYKSLENKGFLGSLLNKEEYVEISTTSTNTGKIPVDGFIKLKDTKEILYCGQTLTNENLLTQETTITHYLRGNANPEIISKSKKVVGCYIINDENGNQVDCFEKQNEMQAFLRSQFQGSTYTTQWVICDSCSFIPPSTHDASNTDKSYVFDALFFVSIVNDTDLNAQPISTLLVNYPTSYTSVATSQFSILSESGFKIDLSHPTLKGYIVKIYLDSGKTTLLEKDVFYFGVPGFDQSSIICKVTTTSPKTFYFDFIGPTTHSLTITT